MLTSDITIGRAPLAIFVATAGVIVALCAVFLAVLLAAPPTIMIAGASGTGLVQAARYDRDYNEALASAFIVAYTSWTPDTFETSLACAGRMCDPALAARLDAEAKRRAQTVEAYLTTSVARVREHRLVEEDAARGRTVFVFRIERIEHFNHVDGAPEEAAYAVTVRWEPPEHGGSYCARIVDVRVIADHHREDPS